MSVVSPQLTAAIQAAEQAVASSHAGLASGSDAVGLLQAAERLRRLAAVCGVDAVGAVHSSGVHLEHGHVSGAAMAKHLGRLSSAECARLDKIRRMNAQCELLEVAWRAGELSVDQASVLARGFANPRVRAEFVDQQERFLGWASKPLRVMERRMADWISLTDQDGPEPRPEPAHEKRDFRMVQEHFSKSWDLRGSAGSLQGDKIFRVFNAYFQAETLADWEAARAIHGDAVCKDLLARTDAQRRADALEQVFADALHNPGRSVPIDTVHNIVWSQESHEEMLRRYVGAEPEPIDIETHMCHNLDGHSLHLGTAFADFLTSKWRRVVQDAAGITIDISRSQRFFTGLARLGVQLSFDSCFWPGCDLAVTDCQIDHTRPAARGGLSEQSNGAPACQRHNRLKERGYSVTRLADSTFSITTPSGELLPA